MYPRFSPFRVLRHTEPMSRQHYFRLGLWTLAALILILVWDLLGLDLALARRFGTSTGFPLRDHWLWSSVLHQGARRVAWTLQLILILSIWWPVGFLRLLTRRERVHLTIATLMTVLIIWIAKSTSQTSCPWELAEFGGPAIYISHWAWGTADGGIGKCFPAGHASAAFSFLAGYFWLREKSPRAAAVWLAITLLAGAVIGFAQQIRGAHYVSHTLWTAWLCWVIAGLLYALLEHRRMRAGFDSGALR